MVKERCANKEFGPFDKVVFYLFFLHFIENHFLWKKAWYILENSIYESEVQVYGMHSSQLEIYTDLVKPLVQEVLAGYNCTIFAFVSLIFVYSSYLFWIKCIFVVIIAVIFCSICSYGQTSTGKTYTMEGIHSHEADLDWKADTTAGIIPRALQHVFSQLEKQVYEKYFKGKEKIFLKYWIIFLCSAKRWLFCSRFLCRIVQWGIIWFIRKIRYWTNTITVIWRSYSKGG